MPAYHRRSLSPFGAVPAAPYRTKLHLTASCCAGSYRITVCRSVPLCACRTGHSELGPGPVNFPPCRPDAAPRRSDVVPCPPGATNHRNADAIVSMLGAVGRTNYPSIHSLPDLSGGAAEAEAAAWARIHAGHVCRPAPGDSSACNLGVTNTGCPAVLVRTRRSRKIGPCFLCYVYVGGKLRGRATSVSGPRTLAIERITMSRQAFVLPRPEMTDIAATYTVYLYAELCEIVGFYLKCIFK